MDIRDLNAVMSVQGTHRTLIALQENLPFCYIFKEKLSSQRGLSFDDFSSYGEKRGKHTNNNNVQQFSANI